MTEYLDETKRVIKEHWSMLGFGKIIPKERYREFERGVLNDLKGTFVENRKPVSEEVESVYEHWNKQEPLITHKSLTKKTAQRTRSALREYTMEEINTSIHNYAQILERPEVYYFTYRWTLSDFLQRGIEKFIDWETTDHNFRRKTTDGSANQPKKGKYGDV